MIDIEILASDGDVEVRYELGGDILITGDARGPIGPKGEDGRVEDLDISDLAILFESQLV